MLLRGAGREDFTVEAFSVAEAVEQGRRKDGPVLLLELSPLETPRLSAFALFVAGVRGLSIPASG